MRAAITLHPFHPVAAAEVFRDLDPWDQAEADVTLGGRVSPARLAEVFAEVDDSALFSAIAGWHGQAFAVFSLVPNGAWGGAVAALMARDHGTWRRPLAAFAARIRAEMPARVVEMGLTRIEARSWSCHPNAPRILDALGFVHECDMAGFGPDGRSLFRQWAWVPPDARPANLPFTPYHRS